MPGKCDKEHTYSTRVKAYYAMLKVPVKATGQVPFRVYYCKQHKGFHYTSKAIYKRKAANNGRRERRLP